jgi:predicted O-methyltransferase YrrM
VFHDIPDRIAKRMQYLERLDARHRKAGAIVHFDRLRQVPPATGKFLALLAASAPPGAFIEIGTSGGYSTLWLAIAAREAGRRITTFEISRRKAKLARETLKAAGVEDVVDLVVGDALEYLPECKDIAFCFLDAEKSLYSKCYEIVVERLVKGGLLAADNVVSHRDEVAPMLRRALRDERVDAMIIPIGSGELVCRRV